MKKVKRYEIQNLKHIDGKEPEVFISREQIETWFHELKADKNISGVVPYLREVKEK